MVSRPKLMAYSMERLPHSNVHEACEIMIRNFPEATPVPKLTTDQMMWTEHLPCLEIDWERRHFSYRLAGREHEIIEFYDRYLAEDLEYFAISPELDEPLYKLAEMYRKEPWPVKLLHFSLPGIYSWGLSVKDENDTPILYNDVLRDMTVKLLATKGRWREKRIKELFPGADVLITIGNGGLGIYGTAAGTGSWKEIQEMYNEQMAKLDGIKCIHCCANFDWSLLMKTDATVINFDAYQYGDSFALYPDSLKEYLERGGTVAWGIVPTIGSGGDITTESPDTLMERLESIIDMLAAKGVNKMLILESSWITPTCHPVSLSSELAERVLKYTREISDRMRDKYFGSTIPNKLFSVPRP